MSEKIKMAAGAVLVGVFLLLFGCKAKDESRFTNSIGMNFVRIQPGTFMMGSFPNEKISSTLHEDLHEVKLTRTFFMQATEVTKKQWFEVMGTRPWKGKKDVRESENSPAVYLSWHDAVLFIQKLNQNEGFDAYRLPTEAEWEYSARAGGKLSEYCFGDNAEELGDYAWYSKNAYSAGEKYAHDVALKKPNAFGLYDMHGNVSEWCKDWYGPYSKIENNTDPEQKTMFKYKFFGSARVCRGGSFGTEYSGFLTPDNRLSCRSATRDRCDPKGLNATTGFRVVYMKQQGKS